MILLVSDELPRPTSHSAGRMLCVTVLGMLSLLLLLLSLAPFVSAVVGRSANYRSVVNLSSFDRLDEQILIIRDWHDDSRLGAMPSTHFPPLMNKEHAWRERVAATKDGGVRAEIQRRNNSDSTKGGEIETRQQWGENYRLQESWIIDRCKKLRKIARHKTDQ